MRRNPNTGRWELEDDAPISVRAVEESPRAAYTSDDQEAIACRVESAVAAARFQERLERRIQEAPYIDSFAHVWQEFLDDIVTTIQDAIERKEDNGRQERV